MKKMDYFWKTNPDWYTRLEDGDCIIREDAPPEAQTSYEHFLEQCKEVEEDYKRGFID